MWVMLAATTLLSFASVASADELTPDVCASTAERASDLRDSGHLHDAAASFAICARDACPKIVRDDCRRGLQSINEGGPHLVPRLRDSAGRDVLDAELLLDDAPLPARGRTNGVLVDPGAHVLRARRGGVVIAERGVVVAATDGLRAVDLTIDAPAAPPPPVAARPSKLPWIIGGAGLGVLVVGGALGTWTYLDYRSLKDDCGPRCSDARVDPVHTRGVVADVMMGVGLVTLVTAVVLKLTDHGAPRTVGLAW